MASVDPFPDGPWHCKHCHKPFSHWDDLMKHKEQTRNDNQEDHIYCKVCGRDFQTLAGEMRHMQMEHPLEQNLDCPGCGRGPFKRLGALMSHIERGFCARIDISVLDELREEKLEFPRRLEQLTQESVKGNYMKYMPSTHSRSSASGWYAEENATSIGMAWEQFPTLTATNGAVEAITSSMSDGKHGKKSKPLDSIQQPPFQPAIKADVATFFDGDYETPDLIEFSPPPASKPVVTTVPAGMDPDDPSNPSFNAASFYCSITEKFNCPKSLCRKTFKTAGGLISHLRSPVHGNTTYRCPCCLKVFKTLTGVTSHTEARGSKCRIQDTAHYETFMDQLTAGIVDIERTRYQDGSILFKTSEQAKQRLRGGAIKEKMKYPIDSEPRKVY
ncbi:hypothetical protein Trco_001453, partial [Trichoderma cornu-damae]